ncbi:MAG: ABC transporter permease [Burkholderiales bacterium]|jgi:putative spermidine/putrescine transport system permease protein|nr:ABC transporter permease [Burkholderiales bacterium]
MTAAALPAPRQRGGALSGLSSFLHGRPGLLLALLLAPPLVWLGIIYLGSLFTLLAHSFFGLDEFSGVMVREVTLDTWKEFFGNASNGDVVLRSALMAAAVTAADALIAFPLAYFMVRFAGIRTRGLLYLAVMLPLWSSYLVRVYAWKLILAKEGIVSWFAQQLHLGWLLEAVLEIPVVGGPSLSTSYIGTFIVFSYIWLPFMILPIVAALERVPGSVIEASGDLGADAGQTFRKVILPLAFPGVVAGSIFTFSLTLGDYIIPSIIGKSTPFLGETVFRLQGTAGNIPMAAAFTVVPVVVMGVYLMVAKRLGAFDAL